MEKDEGKHETVPLLYLPSGILLIITLKIPQITFAGIKEKTVKASLGALHVMLA